VAQRSGARLSRITPARLLAAQGGFAPPVLRTPPAGYLRKAKRKSPLPPLPFPNILGGELAQSAKRGQKAPSLPFSPRIFLCTVVYKLPHPP